MTQCAYSTVSVLGTNHMEHIMNIVFMCIHAYV